MREFGIMGEIPEGGMTAQETRDYYDALIKQGKYPRYAHKDDDRDEPEKG